MFGLTILGTNSAIPAFNRHPTAQALVHEDQIYLIDCGEGTQTQLLKYKIRRSKINHIFISHLHGDHYFGLIGLITSMGLLGRDHPLCIYGPSMLEKIIDLQLRAAGTTLKFKLQFVGISKACILFQNPKMEVSCFLVQHRIECWGFLFKEKKLPRKLIPEKAIQAGIPSHFFHNLQLGEPYTKENGEMVANEAVTIANNQGKTYGYSADTLYDESLCDLFRGADLLYHEATYLHEMIDRAAERYHTTALQAAYIAKKAGVKKLLLGHFSSKYENLDPFLTEAASVFEAVELALEGVTYRI